MLFCTGQYNSVNREYFSAQGKGGNDGYIEVFKNPTSSEIQEIKKNDYYSSIREIIDDGIIYVWAGSFVHGNMEILENKFDLGSRMSSSFHFATFPDGWTIDVYNLHTDLRTIYEILNKYKNQLSKIGNINKDIHISKTTDNIKCSEGENGMFHFKNWDEMDKFMINNNNIL